MTSSVQDVVKEDGTTPADAVRRRRRLDPRRPRGQPDARVRRDLRGLRRRPRTDPLHRDRPEHPERRRADDDRLDHDHADGDQRLRHGPEARRDRHASRRRDDHRLRQAADPDRPAKNDRDPRARTDGSVEFYDHDQRARTLANGQYFGRITLDAAKTGGSARSRSRSRSSSSRASSRSRTPAARRRIAAKTGVSHCTVDRHERAAALPPTSTLTVTNRDKGKPRLHEHLGTGDRDQQ